MDKKVLAESLSDLRQLNTWLPKAFETVLGISLIRYEIMSMLLATDSIVQNDIQKELGMDRAAVSRHLQTLEDKDYIVRKKDTKDSRFIRVSLSEKGKHVMTSCNTDHDAVADKLVEGITPEQIEAMSLVLKQMRKNVEDIIGKKDIE